MIHDTIAQWFEDLNACDPDSSPEFAFAGVLVFERVRKVKRWNRLAMVANECRRQQYLKEGSNMTLPVACQPNKAWEGARCVGFASSFEETVRLMEPTWQSC